MTYSPLDLIHDALRSTDFRLNRNGAWIRLNHVRLLVKPYNYRFGKGCKIEYFAYYYEGSTESKTWAISHADAWTEVASGHWPLSAYDTECVDYHFILQALTEESLTEGEYASACRHLEVITRAICQALDHPIADLNIPMLKRRLGPIFFSKELQSKMIGEGQG